MLAYQPMNFVETIEFPDSAISDNGDRQCFCDAADMGVVFLQKWEEVMREGTM